MCSAVTRLTNLMKFIEIRRIQPPPNFKIGDFSVHRFKIFEKIKKYKKTRINSEQTGENIFQKWHSLVC
jgi:hypothetical protein